MSKEIFINIIPTTQTDHLFHVFMCCLMKQEYPKDKLTLQFDVSLSDKAYEYLKLWIPQHEKEYKQISVLRNSISMISEIRNTNIEEFLKSKCEYYFSVNTDCFLLDRDLITKLLYHERDFIAPMCDSIPDNTQSNFTSAVTENGYFATNNDFGMLKRRELSGIIDIPLIHVIYMVSRRMFENTKIRYDETGEYDFITLPRNIRNAGLKMYMLNEEIYCLTISRIGESLDPIKERNMVMKGVLKHHKSLLDINKSDESTITDLSKHISDEDTPMDSVILDLNAGIGIYTLGFSNAMDGKKGGWVYAYDEDKVKEKQLRRNVDNYMIQNVKILDDFPRLQNFNKVRLIKCSEKQLPGIIANGEFIENNKPYFVYSGTFDFESFINTYGYFPPINLQNDDKLLIPI